ncbi:Uma2 family endonuclease [Phormidesmis priestleyi ULC007]|uniref:Uma2 family endonuclease n=1 Tax=Phormidesmis priestleyi ULC007 TaxID=1920490 RepID=A0A2T1DCW1_9CYAN|nr:Uma2 family endonuclease [Phormidesmis priestleyi]PSB18328.1 Uma2 family endonuclease [Phormidesmis priestleyi ULC007]PZO46517.1 MAG: Uma2 family endonuclease [Phormidesmis priestleyi]
MTQAKPRFRTIEEYLDYDDGTDTRYELVNGELVEKGAESTLNTQIAVFLIAAFLQLGISYSRLGIKQQISVSSSEVTAREPDLMVHSEESAIAISGQKQALLTFEMPIPSLVIEVVSPGKPGSDNYNRNYVEKPKEYAARGIPEFWQIDPDRTVLAVLTLKDEAYQSRKFRGDNQVVSVMFPDLQLMADQILRAGG